MPFRYRVRSSEEMEARLNQSSGNFISYIKSEYRIFQPQKMENCIRILPPSSLWEHAPHYGLDVYVHFGVGPSNGSVICLDQGVPQMGLTGGECPICREMYKAMRARDEQLTRELRPTKRVLMFLLNRRDEGQGVLIWGCPQTLDVKITKASRSREDGTWRLVDHPEKGHDVYFDKEGEQLLTKYEGVQLATRSSTVNSRWLDFVEENPLPECLVWRDYDEVLKVFEGGVNADADDDRPPRGGRPGSDRPPRNGSDRPPREDRGFSDRPPREASEDREPPPHEDEDSHDQQEPWDDDRNPDRQEPEREPERRVEEETDLRPANRRAEAPIRRPGSAPRGNGADPVPPRSSVGKDRAAELRAQFLSGGRK